SPATNEDITSDTGVVAGRWPAIARKQTSRPSASVGVAAAAGAVAALPAAGPADVAASSFLAPQAVSASAVRAASAVSRGVVRGTNVINLFSWRNSRMAWGRAHYRAPARLLRQPMLRCGRKRANVLG